MLPTAGDLPPKAGKGFAKSMLGVLNAWRAFFISSRIVSIDVRSTWDFNERLGAELKPTPTGTLVKMVVGPGLPAFPAGDGEYLLWVKITGGVLDDTVDPNPAWFGPPAASGTQVLGSIDGGIQWIETDTCEPPP